MSAPTGSGADGTWLFTYGTLQLPTVQLEKYGRLLSGEPDRLAGFRLEEVDVLDPDVVRLSGKARHPIAVRAPDSPEGIAGIAYLLSDAELQATDDYEVDPYVREPVVLTSGRRAFAYVLAD
jgi:hypothetical protein